MMNPSHTGTASVGRRASRGAAIMSAKTFALKFASTLGNLAAAAVLLDEDFGIIAIAFAIVAYSSIVQQIGVREVLINKQHAIQRWTNSAFWLMLLLGTLAAILTASAAYPISKFLDQESLLGVTLVLALSQPLLAASLTSQSMIEYRLRFKPVALIETASQLVQILTMLALAFSGFGPYSFAWAWVAMAAVKAVLFLYCAPPKLQLNAQIHRWPTFIKAGIPTGGAVALQQTIQQADYAILAFVTRSEAIIGQYFFAFSQSTLASQLFGQSIMRVLMPGLSSISNQQARVGAFTQAVRLVALAAMPLAFIQAAIADPFLSLLFKDKWNEAIMLLQILSIGAALGTISWLSEGLLMAQQRYVTRFKLRLFGALFFVMMISLGAIIGSHLAHNILHIAVGVAISVISFRMIYTPISLYVACSPAKISFAYITMILLRPLLGAAISILIPAFILKTFTIRVHLPDWQYHTILIIGTPSIGISIFWIWCRLLQRHDMAALRIRLAQALPQNVYSRIPNWIL